MKHYVQLKDGIVFSNITTPNEIPTSDTIIEVNTDGSVYLNKKYINGNFEDAPKIRYATIDESNNNTVVSIEETIFSSDVKSDKIIISDPAVKVLWTWDGEKFNPPAN